MTHWRYELRAGDPIGDGQLASAEVHRIRTALLAATDSRSHAWRPLPVLLVAGLLTAVVAGMWAVRQLAAEPDPIAVSADAQPSGPGAGGVRQLQFSLPSGTRIIWVFDPSFEMR